MLQWWKTLYFLTIGLIGFGFYLSISQGTFDVANASTVFAGILTASAAILAISYSLTQFNITKISENYSSHIIALFNELSSHKIAYFLFFSVVMLSAISLSIKVNDDLTRGLIYANLFGFTFAMGFSSKYFLETMHISNPVTFATTLRKILYKKYRDDISDFDNISNDDIEEILVSMSDAAVKSISRNEIRICNKFIEELRQSALDFLMLKDMLDSRLDDPSIQINNSQLLQHPIKLIFEHFQRIFQKAYDAKEYEITKKILVEIEVIFNDAISKKNSDYVIELMIYNQREKPLFLELQKILSENDKFRNEKIDLLNFYFRIITTFMHQEHVENRYAYRFVDDGLYRLLKLMIDKNDDFSVRNFFEKSPSSFYTNPSSLIFEIRSKLNDYFSGKQLDDVDWLVRIATQSDANMCKNLLNIMNTKEEILFQNVTEENKSYEEFKKIKQMIWHLYIISRMFGTCFWIGSYLVFLGSSRFELLNYFWHATMSKNNVMGWTNRPLISDSTTWNTLFYFYKNYSIIDFSFTPYRDPLLHLEKFYLMTLIRNDSKFDFPNINEIKELFVKSDYGTIHGWFELCDKILNYKIDERLMQNDDFVNPILTISDFGEEITQKVNWLKRYAQNCKNQIILQIEVTDDQKRDLSKIVRDMYAQHTLVEQISDVSFSTRTTKFSYSHNKVDIERIRFSPLVQQNFFEQLSETLIHRITRSESEHIVNELKKKIIKTKRCKRDNLTQRLELELSRIKKDIPDTIFFSQQFRTNISSSFNFQDNHIVISGHSLRVVFSSLLKNEIFLSNHVNIQTIFKNYDGQRFLFVTHENEDNSTLFTMNSLMKSKIRILNKNKILKFTISDLIQPPNLTFV